MVGISSLATSSYHLVVVERVTGPQIQQGKQERTLFQEKTIWAWSEISESVHSVFRSSLFFCTLSFTLYRYLQRGWKLVSASRGPGTPWTWLWTKAYKVKVCGFSPISNTGIDFVIWKAFARDGRSHFFQEELCNLVGFEPDKCCFLQDVPWTSGRQWFLFFFLNFYCYSITVVCLFSPSLHSTPNWEYCMCLTCCWSVTSDSEQWPYICKVKKQHLWFFYLVYL